MASIRSIIRFDEWKASKVNPIFAGAILAAWQNWNPVSSVGYVVVFMVIIFLNASFGYAANNLSDREVDRLAGKSNPFSRMPYSTALWIVLGAVILGMTIAAVGFWGRFDVIALTALSFGLAAAYSAKPFRFKERGALGLTASSLAQRVVPLVIVFQLFNAWSLTTIAYLALAFVIGLRFMLIHQMDDLDNDIRSGVATFSTARGLAYSQRVVLFGVMPLELGLLGVVIVSIGAASWIPGVVLGIVVLLYALMQTLRSSVRDAYFEVSESYLGFNTVYAVAMPLVTTATLAVAHPFAWPLGLVALALVAGDVMRGLRSSRAAFRIIWQRLRSGVRAAGSKKHVNFAFPIAVALFNRPEYARQVLNSLLSQSMKIDSCDVIIHLDGYVGSRDEAREIADQTGDVEALARSLFPAARFIKQQQNVGIARAHRALEDAVFSDGQAPWALICEEDFVLHEAYLTTLVKMIETYDRDPDVVMVSATGDSRVIRAQEDVRPVLPMLHLWAFAIRRAHVDERQPVMTRYLESVSHAQYWERDDTTVWHACASVGVFPMGSSQDYVKRAAMRKYGRIALTTAIPFGFYVGEHGEHFNPHAYRALGYDQRPEPVDQIPDFSGDRAAHVLRAKHEFDVMMAEDGATNIIDVLVKTRAVTHSPSRWHVQDDLALLEGPFPEIGLYRPFVWLTGREANVVLEVNHAGRYTVSVVVANNHDGQEVTVASGTDRIESEVPVCGQHAPHTIQLECSLNEGTNAIRVSYSRSVEGVGDTRSLGLMLLDVFI